jgi:hypothetical protein
MDLAIDAKCGGSKPIGDGPFFKSFGFSCFLLVRHPFSTEQAQAAGPTA